ncbi:protein naked cuticle homolog 2 isoform X2 [Sphaeramia orbicularis]|uniref:protein naked cuticle homolog 2 isoform X2 n=1 Tax=Sphaeramia orbicularis TaxID=375764 RepID=UPI001180D133|nr:protein naked cuticle homolog 2-like isoform X2 [Sphaeramia orbicularis]XP_030003071.1 protein naked cuticle homolog 2-like isoform X2 [Sphaeramia orbicularis]
MGKLHSKLAPKRRQSPEGGILASIHTPRERPAEGSRLLKTRHIQKHTFLLPAPSPSTLFCRKSNPASKLHSRQSMSDSERRVWRWTSWVLQNLFRELKETSPNNCDLKVTLPPERGSDYGSHLPEKKQSKKRDSHTADTEDIKHAEDPRQEWVFTLYNFDHSSKATKEDMSSLIHSMYEALEASVKQPSGGTTVLKFNLVMSPSLQDKVSQPEKEQSAFREAGSPKRRLYCADENIERRNHYLDLAGVENYTSKFDTKESPSQEPRHNPLSAPQHHLVLAGENYSSSEHPGGSSLFHSPKGKSSDKEGRSTRVHSQHPASWCQPSHPKHPVYSTPQRTHSKRLRSREQETISPGSQTQPRGDREISAKRNPTCGSPALLALRHDHHHYHEHHHHHHHHHYHPA